MTALTKIERIGHLMDLVESVAMSELTVIGWQDDFADFYFGDIEDYREFLQQPDVEDHFGDIQDLLDHLDILEQDGTGVENFEIALVYEIGGQIATEEFLDFVRYVNKLNDDLPEVTKATVCENLLREVRVKTHERGLAVPLCKDGEIL